VAFKQLIINIDSKAAEVLSDIFSELNALSVSIEDQYEGTKLEQPIFNEPGMDIENLWQHSKLKVLFNFEADIEAIVILAQQLLEQQFDYIVEIVDDQDWVRKTQDQFLPIKVTDNFYIVPSWHQSPNKNAINLNLDPGLAFGTGSHPTTFMCLQWIALHVTASDKVVDYGCGSGILAIAAKKFAASCVVATDIDPQALLSTQYNAQNNHVTIEIVEPKALESKSFNIVIANILSNPLKFLAPLLSSLSNDKLLLSGILVEQIDQLTEVYSQWFNVKVANTMDGWVLLECSKK
jgi:ribosomal protein L11 methyltransferase